MPIYEFKCLKCNEFFELLVMKKDEEVELRCPKCHAAEFERVLSSTNFCVGNCSSGNQERSIQTRTCSTGSCTTYDIPGPTR